MKWAVFLFSVALVFPLSAWVRNNPEKHRFVWFVFGVLPCILSADPKLDIALINWSGWPGHTKGVLFSAMDAAALAIYFSLPKSQRPVPFRVPMLLYFGMVLLSVLNARVSTPALFYAWHLLRMFLVYLIVARASTDRTIIVPLLTGLAVGLCIETVVAGYQRTVLGDLQPDGTFSHQNLLGMTTNLLILPLFALFLSGRTNKVITVGLVGGCIVAVLTTSRATVGLGAVGLAMVFVLSVARERTSRKAKVGIAGALVLTVLGSIAIASFSERFIEHPVGEGGFNEREAFIEASRMMLADHPFGVGANNFVLMANIGNYYGRAGISWMRDNRRAHVHNAYWLTAAETGYLGLGALILLLLRPMVAALSCGWRHRDDRRGDLLLGLAVSILIVSAHAYFEWVFIVGSVQTFLAINFGLIAGLTQQLGYWTDRADRRADPKLDDNTPVESGTDLADPETRQFDDEFWGIDGPAPERAGESTVDR